MSIQPPDDLLTNLRANLRRIEDEHSDKDLTPVALELKCLLLRRIANIEAAMKNLEVIIGNAAPEKKIEPDVDAK